MLAEVKCYVILVTTYGILIGLWWKESVRLLWNFRTEDVTVRGGDGKDYDSQNVAAHATLHFSWALADTTVQILKAG